jgi:hypothetical protein
MNRFQYTEGPPKRTLPHESAPSQTIVLDP